MQHKNYSGYTTTHYSSSKTFANMCSSRQSRIVHGRIFFVPSTTQTVTYIAYKQHNRACSCRDCMSMRLLRVRSRCVLPYCCIVVQLKSLASYLYRIVFLDCPHMPMGALHLLSFYLCWVIVSCVCTLPAHPHEFEATSQDEKQEIILLWSNG